MGMIRADEVELLKEGIRKVIYNKWPETKPTWKKIFTQEPSKKEEEYDVGFSGLSQLVKKAEQSPHAIDVPKAGYKTRYKHEGFSLETPIGHEAERDDLYNIVSKTPQMLIETVDRTLDNYGADVFINAFLAAGAGFTTGGDGKALCATDHPLLGGAGTFSNRLSSPAALSVTTFAEMTFLIRNAKNFRGQPLNLVPKWLLFPANATMARTAFEITRSAGRPDTADRADNWASQQGIAPIEPDGWSQLNADFGGDDDMWFMLTDKVYHSLLLFIRENPLTDMQKDIHTMELIHTIYIAFSVGFSDPRGVAGSSGLIA